MTSAFPHPLSGRPMEDVSGRRRVPLVRQLPAGSDAFLMRAKVARDLAQRAIDFTVRSQNPQRGGWRYQPYPQSNDVDTSVFGWMLMALKSGRAGGLRIDEQCLERAAGYLESARIPGEGGRYAYQPASRRTTLAMTAQGFFCQEMLADTLPAWRNANGPTLRRAARDSAEHLLANLPRAADQDGVNYYYWYYATLALFQEGGEGWAVWNRTLSDLLLKLQVAGEWGTAAGSWDPLDRRASQGGRIYSTTMAILSLEVYYRYTRVKGK